MSEINPERVKKSTRRASENRCLSCGWSEEIDRSAGKTRCPECGAEYGGNYTIRVFGASKEDSNEDG